MEQHTDPMYQEDQVRDEERVLDRSPHPYPRFVC